MNAIVLHGKNDKEEFLTYKDSSSNAHWLPWIQRELTKKGILTQTPELPVPYNPEYEKWLEVFLQSKINQDTILIGHSCGAGFLVRYISENSIQVGHVFLIAPWLDIDKELSNNFFNFQIDRNILEKVQSLNIFYSTDDMVSILESINKIKSEVVGNINYFEFTNKGHFCESDLGTREFPELLNEIESKI